MRTLYKSGELYLVQVSDDLVYFGNGEDHNAFGINAVQFLRFNPYMEDVSEKKVSVPNKIRDYIASHSNDVG